MVLEQGKTQVVILFRQGFKLQRVITETKTLYVSDMLTVYCCAHLKGWAGTLVSLQAFSFSPPCSHMFLDKFKRFSKPLNLKRNRCEKQVRAPAYQEERGKVGKNHTGFWSSLVLMFKVTKQVQKQDGKKRNINPLMILKHELNIEAEMGNIWTYL